MRYRQYRFKFYLNASHAIMIQGHLGERHPHTWELAISVLKYRDNFVAFGVVEKRIEEYMQTYQNQFLNEVEPFNIINPTLENVCEYFKDQLKVLLNELGWVLLNIEMSETPTRTYVINLLDETVLETKNQSVDAAADIMLADILRQAEKEQETGAVE